MKLSLTDVAITTYNWGKYISLKSFLKPLIVLGAWLK
jgi:hypothetical protein